MSTIKTIKSVVEMMLWVTLWSHNNLNKPMSWLKIPLFVLNDAKFPLLRVWVPVLESCLVPWCTYSLNSTIFSILKNPINHPCWIKLINKLYKFINFCNNYSVFKETNMKVGWDRILFFLYACKNGMYHGSTHWRRDCLEHNFIILKWNDLKLMHVHCHND